MNDNQQNGQHDQAKQKPDKARTTTPNFLERLAGIFADASKRFSSDHVSKHAAGRQRPKNYRVKRRVRRNLAKRSRQINRQRRKSSTRARSHPMRKRRRDSSAIRRYRKAKRK